MKLLARVLSNSRKHFVTDMFKGHDDLTQRRYMSAHPSIRPSVRPTGGADKPAYVHVMAKVWVAVLDIFERSVGD